MSIEQNGRGYFNIICDICGEQTREYETFRDAVDAKKDEGFKSNKTNGEWQDVCPECRKGKMSGKDISVHTKADFIRNMSDWELACYIEGLVITAIGDESLRDTKSRLEWLKQPYGEEKE